MFDECFTGIIIRTTFFQVSTETSKKVALKFEKLLCLPVSQSLMNLSIQRIAPTCDPRGHKRQHVAFHKRQHVALTSLQKQRPQKCCIFNPKFEGEKEEEAKGSKSAGRVGSETEEEDKERNCLRKCHWPVLHCRGRPFHRVDSIHSQTEQGPACLARFAVTLRCGVGRGLKLLIYGLQGTSGVR